MLTDVLLREGECVGALGINSRGERILFESKSVILATGGMGNIFKMNMNTRDITGDGQAAALRAGAKLVNTEFFQIGLGIVSPVKRGLFLDRILGCHPSVFNNRKEAYLSRYLPTGVSEDQCLNSRSTHYPFTSRSVSKYFDIALFREVLERRGTKNHGVYMDLAKIPGKVWSELPLARIWYQWLKEVGFVVERQLMEIGLFAHAFNGGVWIDQRAETSIPGLFAAGEIAAGPHGADRLGGNMQTSCQVFGARAGIFAARRSKKRVRVKVDKAQLKAVCNQDDAIARASGELVKIVRSRMQAQMWKNVLVERSSSGLSEVLKELEDSQGGWLDSPNGVPGPPWSALECRNMLEMATVIARAAETRRESRGSHYRRDYPEKDSRCGQPIFVQKKGGKTQFWFDELK